MCSSGYHSWDDKWNTIQFYSPLGSAVTEVNLNSEEDVFMCVQ